MFWTVPIPASAVDVNFGAGRARYAMTDMEMPDFFTIPNALFRFLDPPSVPAVTTFDVRFGPPVTERFHVHSEEQGNEGSFLFNQATMTWSASTDDGWSFISDPEPTTSAFAMMAKERNGVFFG